MRINNLLIRFSKKHLVWQAIAPNNETHYENIDKDEVLRVAQETIAFNIRRGYRARRKVA